MHCVWAHMYVCVYFVIFSLEFLIVPSRLMLFIYSFISPFNSSSYNIADIVQALNRHIIECCLYSNKKKLIFFSQFIFKFLLCRSDEYFLW